jgi:asparagine synthase (glutamine-hydrolysing)
MCGINGFYSRKGFFKEEQLRPMTDALQHRGPEASGQFWDGICGLGHRRLKILDLSTHANQPMHSQDGRFTIVFNGEVYNYRELAKQLEISLRTSSDTEVILELFAKEHHRFVYSLNGMFAIAIYDKQAQELFLFRDRIGIKPIYYYWDDENFAFASELKSLLTLPQIHKELNQEAVADFLHLGYVPHPKSIYKNIYKMPAGSWLRLSAEGLHQEKYWDLSEKIYDQATQNKLTLLNQEDEAKKQLKKILQSSVEYRLISDVPLGVFLSGGIDSSLVTALASEASSQPVRTFSIRFEEAKFNEAEYARQVANHLQTQHQEFTVSTQEAKELIPYLGDFYDEPFADSSAIPTYLVSKLAKQSVTVALGGDGGDELFFGYGMYQWAKRLSKGSLKTFRKPLAGALGLMKGNRYQKAKQLFAYPSEPELLSHIFSQEQQFFGRKELRMILQNPVLGAAYQTPTLKRTLTPMEKQAFFDLNYYLPDDLLTKVDRASMQHALELRVPLLDHRIIEFAINLHPSLKFKNGESKYLLKQVLYDYAPKTLFDRHKQGFSIPLVDWLRDDLSFLIDEFLNSEIIERYGIVKDKPIQEMIKKFKKGNTFYYHKIWSLIVLHQFLNKQFG